MSKAKDCLICRPNDSGHNNQARHTATWTWNLMYRVKIKVLMLISRLLQASMLIHGISCLCGRMFSCHIQSVYRSPWRGIGLLLISQCLGMSDTKCQIFMKCGAFLLLPVLPKDFCGWIAWTKSNIHYSGYSVKTILHIFADKALSTLVCRETMYCVVYRENCTW